MGYFHQMQTDLYHPPLWKALPWAPSAVTARLWAPAEAECCVQVKPIRKALHGHKHNVSRGDCSNCCIYPLNFVFLSL